MRFPVPLRRGAALLVLALSGMVAAFATILPDPRAELLLTRSAQREDLELPELEAARTAPEVFIREEQFQRGDTIAGLLGRLGIEAETVARLNKDRDARVLRRMRPGTVISAEVTSEGALARMSFLSGRETMVSIAPEGTGFRVDSQSAPLETRTVVKSSVIHSSLFAATDAAGISDAVAMQLADIFGGDIDFHRDLRKGDRFSVVYELHVLDGRPVYSGRVLAAEFLNQGKLLRAIYYPDADGKSGYFAPDGKSLRKAFLRSPLEFSRVSSGFGMRRHPFLHTWRAHKGVDYAAPTGTRVRSVGDGVVEFAGVKGGYGKVVIVRHRSQTTTLYAHLRGFARGIGRGVRVAQGETIGYVGQTGWATGPHLHYEFLVSGQARNPLSVTLPAAAPVPAHELARFRRHAGPLDAQLDLLAQANLALLQ
jgi:murein DD-endopeptidase MepM/ murein hydrolase activator NlpD